jgi:hypothetical protein
MFRQTKSRKIAKLYSIHALPAGHGFSGVIEAGRAKYQFNFSPKTAAIVNRKLILAGSVTVKAPNGGKRTVDKVEATLLATQGSAGPAPPMPRSLTPPERPPFSSPPVTEATGEFGSVGVIYFKLSGLDGKAAGLPFDLSDTQLNARLYSTSEVERDLQWLYSALVRATLGESPDEKSASAYLAEINRILKEAGSEKNSRQ